jgi:2-oxoisovalerate dehydrogenase E1 component alpha subunit
VDPEMSDGANGTDHRLLGRIYRVAVTCRALDERFWILSRQGLASFVLTARGHEVAQVASAAVARRGHDSAWPYYRDMAVGLALGVHPYEFFLAALGRAADPHSGGRQLNAHLSSPRLRIGSVSSAIAAHIPHAVGAAYAARVLGQDAVALCWFGEGASSEGATHEAMNLAAIHRLPVVFLCENNGYAISVPLRLQVAGESVAARAAAYGLPGQSVDGTYAAASLAATRAAVARARAGEGPSVVEFAVPRMSPHSSQDDDAYRTAAQRSAAEERDPLPRLRAELMELGLLDRRADERLWESARELALRSADAAQARPQPPPDRRRRWLFAGDPPHEYELDPSLEPWSGVFDD